jgi:hypothetical protein
LLDSIKTLTSSGYFQEAASEFLTLAVTQRELETSIQSLKKPEASKKLEFPFLHNKAYNSDLTFRTLKKLFIS